MAQEKVLVSAKIMISGQKYCRHLVQDSLKYLCEQCGYDWTEYKEMVKAGVSNEPHPHPNLFNLQKAQPL